MPGKPPMENPPPLAGLDPADLLRQGAAADTFVDAAPASFNPPSIEELGNLFPQFEILELIGQGGMGAVYKVRQKDLDRIVALKILPPGIGRSPEFSNRFTREARALAKLNHPGIVTLHEFGQQDGLYFILMEFVDGVNLAQLMKSGRISPREALAIVPQICDALQFAHDQGIVHRDIKPENLLLDRQGRVKVADFGIAKAVAAVCPDHVAAVCDRRTSEDESQRRSQTDATLAGKVIGTPAYMAPEQIAHPSEVDHRADIYALGVVFYQMLTGELPGKDLQAPSRKVSIDVRLDEIVLKAMEKNPELRYQQASVMKTRVDGLQTPAHAQSLPRSKSGHGSLRRWWWLYLVMFPMGLLIGLAAGWAWSGIFPKKYEAQVIIETRPTVAGLGPGFLTDQMREIKSRLVLNDVASELKISEKWNVPGDKAIRLLNERISVENIRGTDLISIRVRHTNRQEAADISNALARSYAETQRKFNTPAVEVIVHEEAVPPTIPVSPNKRLALVAGGFGGLILSPLLAFILIRILRRSFPGKDPVAMEIEKNSQQTDEPAHRATNDTRTDPFAITSFILGICSFILWPLGAIPAIVFGHLSRRRIRNSPALQGNGLAIAGLSLGYFFLAASIAGLVVPLLFFKLRNDGVQEAREALSAFTETRTSHAARIEGQVGDPAHAEIEIGGAVRNAGRVRVSNGASLLDALAAGGGWSGNADLRKIRITIPGTTEAQVHDLDAILKGDAVNPVIVPDSTIEIPEK
jgi:serine/threonine protein kinase